MNKLFFVMFLVSSFVYASESPSPKSSPRSKQTNSPKIDVDQIMKFAKRTEKSTHPHSRVKRQSFGSQDFMNAENNITFRNEKKITKAGCLCDNNESK